MLEDTILYYTQKRHFILDACFAKILVDVDLVTILVSNSLVKSVGRS